MTVPEVWALSRSRGPRGDIIYKNDISEPMLRATKLGGMTVFTPKHPDGAAAALVGSAMPVKLTPAGSDGALPAPHSGQRQIEPRCAA